MREVLVTYYITDGEGLLEVQNKRSLGLIQILRTILDYLKKMTLDCEC